MTTPRPREEDRAAPEGVDLEGSEEAADYWTEERMRAAAPAPMPDTGEEPPGR